jgi:maltose alpha-D-glucosyltransferase/alpha-amylase
VYAPAAAYREIAGDALLRPTPLHRLTNSSNSVSLLGDRLFLKAYRRLQSGINPELEMGRFLTDVVGYANCVPVAGSLDYRGADGSVFTLALLQAQVTHQGDAWSTTVDQLARLLEGHSAEVDDPLGDIEAIAERLQVLARRIAELHIALARRTGTPAFEPEMASPGDLQQWATAVRDECSRTLERLWQRRESWAEPLAGLAAHVAAAAPQLAARTEQAARHARPVLKTRLHGDLHLGQVMIARDDFLIIDFEGEPQRTLEQRRAKHSALRDVAGMLRSFDYARHTALQRTAQGAADLERLAPLARRWERRVRELFLRTYRDVAVAGGLYADAADFDAAAPLLELFVLEKALYELRYEMDTRPDWVGVPLAGIAALSGIAA